MNKKEACLAMEGAISMALAGSHTLQWGFEAICKENAELKKENAKLRSIADFQQSSNIDRHFVLKKCKEIIENLLPFEHIIDPYALTNDMEENKRRFHEPFRKAEQLLKEMRE